MIRFKLFGFPVTVHWLFWLVALLFGANAAVGRDNPAAYLVSWVAVVFVSILVHELGHAIFQRKYGGNPEILLYGMGGLSRAVGYFTRGQQIVISIMGPVFGLLLGFLTWQFIVHVGVKGSVAVFTVVSLLWVNVFWSLVNLLPVIPLDGGRIVEAALAHKNSKLVYGIGVGTAAAVAVAFLVLTQGFSFAAIFFGYLAYANFQRMKGIHQGFW